MSLLTFYRDNGRDRYLVRLRVTVVRTRPGATPLVIFTSESRVCITLVIQNRRQQGLTTNVVSFDMASKVALSISLCTFSRALHQLPGSSVSLLIGQIYYFSFGFTTLSSKQV